jgi:hypothetical protein
MHSAARKVRLPAHHAGAFISHVRAVFGIPLSEACRGHLVPPFVDKLITFIDNHGISREGIYRVPGNTARINTLRIRVNQDENQVQLEQDISGDRVHDIAGLLKLFFRSLPEPLTTTSLYPRLISCSRMSMCEDLMRVFTRETECRKSTIANHGGFAEGYRKRSAG